LALLVWP